MQWVGAGSLHKLARGLLMGGLCKTVWGLQCTQPVARGHDKGAASIEAHKRGARHKWVVHEPAGRQGGWACRKLGQVAGKHWLRSSSSFLVPVMLLSTHLKWAWERHSVMGSPDILGGIRHHQQLNLGIKEGMPAERDLPRVGKPCKKHSGGHAACSCTSQQPESHYNRVKSLQMASLVQHTCHWERRALKDLPPQPVGVCHTDACRRTAI